MVCKYCKKTFPENNFEIAATIKGKIYRRLKCKRCKQNTQNRRREKTKLWLTNYKKKQKCSCGESDHRCLDFHHKSNNKDYDVSDMLTFSIKRIKEEINKCIILCANCHRKLHGE